MSEIVQYFKEIPPFTRYFISSVFISSFAMTYKLLSPYTMILDFSAVFKKLQIWRLVTTFLYAGPFSQSFLFSLVMIYFTLRRCEEFYKTKYPEFATMVLFNMLAVCFYSFIYGDVMVLHDAFVFSLMYIWCKQQPDM